MIWDDEERILEVRNELLQFFDLPSIVLWCRFRCLEVEHIENCIQDPGELRPVEFPRSRRDSRLLRVYHHSDLPFSKSNLDDHTDLGEHHVATSKFLRLGPSAELSQNPLSSIVLVRLLHLVILPLQNNSRSLQACKEFPVPLMPHPFPLSTLGKFHMALLVGECPPELHVITIGLLHDPGLWRHAAKAGAGPC